MVHKLPKAVYEATAVKKHYVEDKTITIVKSYNTGKPNVDEYLKLWRLKQPQCVVGK